MYMQKLVSSVYSYLKICNKLMRNFSLAILSCVYFSKKNIISLYISEVTTNNKDKVEKATQEINLKISLFLSDNSHLIM